MHWRQTHTVVRNQELPCHVERSTSRPLCEVKRCRARLVLLRWGTTLEAPIDDADPESLLLTNNLALPLHTKKSHRHRKILSAIFHVPRHATAETSIFLLSSALEDLLCPPPKN